MIVYENDNFIVVYFAHTSDFFVRTKEGEYCNHFGYSILSVPILSLASRAKLRAIKYADKLNKLSESQK